jgi:hypothetical protein
MGIASECIDSCARHSCIIQFLHTGCCLFTSGTHLCMYMYEYVYVYSVLALFTGRGEGHGVCSEQVASQPGGFLGRIQLVST